jgi:hypothetical protein
MLVGEGSRTFPEWIIPTDPAYRNNALALWTDVGGHLGIPGFAKGGIFGSIAGVAGDVFSGTADLVGSALSAIVRGAVDALLAPLLGVVNAGLDATGAPGFIKAIPQVFIRALVQHVKNQKSKIGGGALLDAAKQFLGIPYVWGGGHGGPETVAQATLSGLDCSGLVDQAAYMAHIPSSTGIYGTTLQQQSAGIAVASLDMAAPGDLVLFAPFVGGEAFHVGIYSGNGQMINAPFPGTTVSYAATGVPQYIRRISYDNGGMLPTGMSLAYNGTGSPEPIGGGITVIFQGNVYAGPGGEDQLAERIRVSLLRRGRSLTATGLA